MHTSFSSSTVISALNITKISLENKHSPCVQSVSGLVQQKEEFQMLSQRKVQNTAGDVMKDL